MVENIELYHHGVKGQRWGVRRYQNEDGSLTAEGYQHWGLNPDGSKFKGRYNRNDRYTENTTKKAKSGLAAGTALGTLAGAVAGPTGMAFGAYAGGILGATLGTVYGAVDTKVHQQKIRKLLKENGTVYVKDL